VAILFEVADDKQNYKKTLHSGYVVLTGFLQFKIIKKIFYDFPTM
jgi:hypothetical protein